GRVERWWTVRARAAIGVHAIGRAVDDADGAVGQRAGATTRADVRAATRRTTTALGRVRTVRWCRTAAGSVHGNRSRGDVPGERVRTLPGRTRGFRWFVGAALRPYAWTHPNGL